MRECILPGVRSAALLLIVPWIVAPASGCSDDALYTYCTDESQCGSRTYDDGDDEIEVYLTCIEATVEVQPGRTTRGQFCTIDCFSDAECDSRIGLGDGRCVQLEGDDIAFCYQRCSDEIPCYPSSQCETIRVDGQDVRVCLPNRLPD